MVSVCVGVYVGVCACIRAISCIHFPLYPLPREGATDRVRYAVGGWSKRLYVPVTRKVSLTD